MWCFLFKPKPPSQSLLKECLQPIQPYIIAIFLHIILIDVCMSDEMLEFLPEPMHYYTDELLN